MNILIQPLAAVEHSGAAIDSVSDLLVVVMELENVLMEVMSLTVVSCKLISTTASPVVPKTHAVPIQLRF